MLIGLRTTDYLHRAVAALEAGTVAAEYITDTCSECDTTFHPRLISNAQDHVMWVGRGVVAMLITCEFYWPINPNTLGIPGPHWQPTDPIGDGQKVVAGSVVGGSIIQASNVQGDVAIA